VLVTATLEERLPPWLKNQGRGWSPPNMECCRGRRTSARAAKPRPAGLRGARLKIQRLIGRSLRTVTDLQALGERADHGGLRRHTGRWRHADGRNYGAWIALRDCIEWMKKRSMVTKKPAQGITSPPSPAESSKGEPVLDLDYAEDSEADTDMKFRDDRNERIVEIQGTAEKTPFSDAELAALIALARKGVARLIELQKLAVD